MAADAETLELARKAREKADLLVQALKAKKINWIKKDIIEAIVFLRLVAQKEDIRDIYSKADALIEKWCIKREPKMRGLKTVGELYGLIAPFYEKGVSKFMFEIEEPVVKKMLPKLKGLKVLDVGCGTGRWTSRLAATGANVIGVDKSSAMLKFAKKRVGKAKFLLMDSRKLKFQPNSFNFVFQSLMLSHMPDWKKAVKEMIRVCKPGGLIFISDINGARLFGKPQEMPFSVSKKNTVQFVIYPIMPSEIIEFALKSNCELMEFKEPKQKLPKKYIQRFHYQPPLQIIMLRKKH